MKKQKELLDKYFRGETSEAEEKQLKELFKKMEQESAEKDMFGYFTSESQVPEDLESSIFSAISEKQNQTKNLRKRWISIISAAAAVLIVLSIYLNIQTRNKAQMENNFLVMEKALFEVSESIQPEENEEMLVLWVDNDIEIIIN